ncbi:phosphate transport system substrate-binding protein [Dyadobacter jejuensis]|uniref:Phosphate transport system substrate-binding protein n=1 Tax=Dyadobacter jejuensis TaxID=1082580 RepID=A0A316ARI4_9BACT|nr:substrate-binding domain-containing protein [Dyadobacter jejuensis]PWJ59966.1 phosphate transport system substrate-binding protein [Dyadobacter jejuensis]
MERLILGNMKGLLLIVSLTCFLAACNQSNERLDNPTRGEITVASDESFKPLVDALTNAYEGIYPNAHFILDYKPEQNAILQLLQDSARIVFATRELNDKEKEIIRRQKGSQRAQHIATDGLALVVSNANTDSLMTLRQVKEIFEGKIKTWEQLEGGNTQGLITLVFDNINASNLNFVLDKFGLKSIDHLRVISAGSNEKVIEMIRENPKYLGFIGVSWISDGHAIRSAELSKGINVLGISESDKPESKAEYIQPFQSGLEFKRYPLHRELYILSREGYSGLGGGLMTYIARDVGGLIIQKMGLLPTVPYPRQLEITTGNNF